MTQQERTYLIQHALHTIAHEMLNATKQSDPAAHMITASSAVKMTLSLVTEVLPPALQQPVQTILDQHDAIWKLGQAPSYGLIVVEESW
jgi:hypothetical protein